MFKPRINAISNAIVSATASDLNGEEDLKKHVPIFERFSEVQRQKQEHLHSLRVEEFHNKDATFRPQINPTSRNIVDLQKQLNLNSELDSTAPVNKKPSGSSEKDCTFKPKLSKKTEKIVLNSQAFQSTDFLERQQLFDLRVQSKLEAAQKATQETFNANQFQPAISSTSEMLALAKRVESKEERIRRLAIKDKEKNEALRVSLHEQYYSQFTFHPQLNKVSQTLARPTRDITRHQSSRINDDIVHQLEEDFKAQCTFKPQISRRSAALSDSSLVNSMIGMGCPVEKERKLEEARFKQEYEELKQCTFQPKTSKNLPDFSKNIQVAGIAKHLDRLQQAKKQEEEKKQREEEVFKVNSKAKDLKFTVPQPFHLHTDQNAAVTKEKFEAKYKEIERMECPFRPNTNARIASDILKNFILCDEDDDIFPKRHERRNDLLSQDLQVVDI